MAAGGAFQAAATETAARNSLASAEREGRFAGAFWSVKFWTGLHEALGAALTWSPQRHAAPSQVGNGVVAGALRSSAGERARDFFFWPALVRLVELAINGSASPSGPATRPSTPTAASTPAL